MTSLARLIDLQRYPIEEIDGEGARLVRDCRRQLDESALCCLEGFLLPAALRQMRAEVLAQQHQAYWIDRDRTGYSWLDPSNFPEGHAVNTFTRQRYGIVTRDRFAEDGPLLTLYKSDVLTDFLRRCLGFDAWYPVECPYLSLNVKVMQESARLGWHFDSNDGAVSLLLQSAAEGGHYEYVPYLRSDGDENYAEVAATMRGEATEQVVRANLQPGTLTLFKGGCSLHRVSEVLRGDPDRLIALFSYDQERGRRFTQRTVRNVLGTVPGTAESSFNEPAH